MMEIKCNSKNICDHLGKYKQISANKKIWHMGLINSIKHMSMLNAISVIVSEWHQYEMRHVVILITNNSLACALDMVDVLVHLMSHIFHIS